jgi:hypothetical protein
VNQHELVYEELSWKYEHDIEQLLVIPGMDGNLSLYNHFCTCSKAQWPPVQRVLGFTQAPVQSTPVTPFLAVQ